MTQRAPRAMPRLLTYWNTGNLGDALQTIALSRFLPLALGIPRSRLTEQLHPEELFVVNGWHRWPRAGASSRKPNAANGVRSRSSSTNSLPPSKRSCMSA